MTRRVWGPLAIAIALASMTAGGVVITQGGGPEPGNANVWIDQDGGNCVRQSTAGAYVNGDACAGIAEAVAEANAGDLILMKGGTSYSGLSDVANRSDLSLGSAQMVLHPAPGESVVILGGFHIATHDFTIDGGDTVGVDEPNRFTVYGEAGAPGSGTTIDFDGTGANRDLVMEDAHLRNFFFNADDTTLRFSEIGPSTLGPENFCSDLIASTEVTGVVIEYNLIHGLTTSECQPGDHHLDALDIFLHDGEVRGNRIWDCATQCLFTGDEGSMLVEHNMIEETNTCGACGANGELPLMGVTETRYNTVEGTAGWGCETAEPCGPRPGDHNVHHNLWLSESGCDTDSTGIVVVVCDSNVSPDGDPGGGTNSVSCTPEFTDGPYTDVDREAKYFLAADPDCTNGLYGASDPLIPTGDGS